MTLRNKDIKQLISMIMLSVGGFLVASDLQEIIKLHFGTTGSIIIGVFILLTAGFLFKLA